MQIENPDLVRSSVHFNRFTIVAFVNIVKLIFLYTLGSEPGLKLT
jgi:hypothetical protein